MTGTDAATYTREAPGMSAFALEDGVVYHTYSAYARGLDALWGMYQWLDRRAEGAQRDGFWFRRRDEYGERLELGEALVQMRLGSTCEHPAVALIAVTGRVVFIRVELSSDSTLAHTATPSLDLGSVVPMSRVLVTGMSGTGKSSALAELGRRGYRVVDTVIRAGASIASMLSLRRVAPRRSGSRSIGISGLLDSEDGRSLFVEGCVRNQSSSTTVSTRSSCSAPLLT